MQLVLNEDQSMLEKTASAFIKERSPVSRFRSLRDGGDERGYSQELYGAMAELGWTAIPFAEKDGGLDMGLAGAIIVSEAMGRGLAPEPFLTAVMMGGQALALAGSDAQREQWLPGIIDGSKVVALAHHERGARFDLGQVSTTAERKGDGFVLRGAKHQVLDGFGADAYVIPARMSDSSDQTALSLFLVPADAGGLTVTRQQRVDSRNAAGLTLDGVSVGADAVLGKLDAGGPLLDGIVDRATVALCGEMLGSMSAAFEMTLDYLKERKQFDQVIGSFQALKHRAAKMFIEVELARSAVMAAARAIDDSAANAKALVSVAKARCSDAFVLIGNEAVQLHGGIGMTDEHDIGFYIKRARAAELTFGDAAYHRARFAELNGY